MSVVNNSPLVARFRFLSRAASIAVIAGSCLVLAGWALDVEPLKTVFPGMVAMNPGGTALGFLLAGVALWLSQAEWAGTPRHRLALGLAAAVTLIAVLR